MLAELVAIWMTCEPESYGIRNCDWVGLCKLGLTQTSNINSATIKAQGDEELRSSFNRQAQLLAAKDYKVGEVRNEGVTDPNILCGALFVHRSRMNGSEESAEGTAAEGGKKTSNSAGKTEQTSLGRGELNRQAFAMLRRALPSTLANLCYTCGKDGRDANQCRADMKALKRSWPFLDLIPAILPYLVASGLITQVPQRP